MSEEIFKLKGSERIEKRLPDTQIQFDQKWNETVTQYRSFYHEIYCNGTKNEKKVALTFDDAPDVYCTPKILNLLKHLHVKASFSIIGLYIEENKALLKRIYEEGHTIINHTYMHYDLSLLSKEILCEELEKTQQLIYESIGVKPAIMRPPYGILSDFAVKEIEELCYKILLWSFNTYDWLATTPGDILYHTCERIRPGEIILMHSYEKKEPTVEALEALIVGIREKGFEIVPVDELLKIKSYH